MRITTAILNFAGDEPAFYSDNCVLQYIKYVLSERGLIMNRIKQLREERSLSQKELGEAIGLQRTAIAKYESENRKLSLNVACKLCDSFGCSIDCLLGRTEPAALNLDDGSVVKAYHAASDRDRKILDLILFKYLG